MPKVNCKKGSESFPDETIYDMHINIHTYIIAKATQMSLIAQSFRTGCMNANKASLSTPSQLLLSPLPAGQVWLLLLLASQPPSDGH